ncbi:protein NEDD1-like [Halichondria panicea]|uniref:protein NEDD1-like n=1 Tax=Halichondria panicea TaxID=6063 RepID=UPI00312B729B
MTELVTGARNSVVFWEEKTLTRKRAAEPFPDSDYHISSLSWSSNNSKLAVVPKCGDRVAVCDFRDDIITWSYLVHKEDGAFTCGCLLGNSRYLASGCGNSSVFVWDLKHKNIIKTFPGHSGAVNSVVATSNDQLVVSGGQDGHIFLHSLSGVGKSVQLTPDQPSPQAVSRLSVSLMEQSHLGCVCEGGEVSLWSIESQRKLTTFTTKHSDVATDLSFTPSNKILMVSVGLDSCIRCYDLQTRKMVATIAAPTPLSSVSILRDGSTLLAGGTDGKLYLYELRSLKTPKSVTEAHQTAVTRIAPQTPLKMLAKRSSSRDRGSHSKDASMSNKSPPRGQRSSQEPRQDVSFLPETMTPFVTQQRGVGGAPLEVATPYSLMKGGGKRGPPTASAMVTPANSDGGNMSSIFSPLDSKSMTTPLSSAGKITASVPPTQRPPTISQPPATNNTLTTSTPASVVQAPFPRLPIATPLLQSNKSAHSTTSGNSGAGIFSPLNSGRHGDLLIGQSPLLIDTSSPLLSGHMTPQEPPPEPRLKHSVLVSQALEPVTRATVTDVSRADLETPLLVPSETVTMEERGDSPLAPPPSMASGVQTQYLERVVKDSTEELWYSVHRDTRGLTVDMIRQFLTLQEGLAHQFAVLNDKVDRLSDENKRLHELVHQYMPKH